MVFNHTMTKFNSDKIKKKQKCIWVIIRKLVKLEEVFQIPEQL